MVLDFAVAVVEVVDAAHPGDTGPLETWLDANPLADVLCILGKTEGNGCVNDYTRGYATSAIKDALRRVQSRRIVRASDDMRRKLPKLYESRMEDAAIIMSGGTEGEHSPIDPLSQFCFPLSTHTFPTTRRSPVPPLYRVRELIRREGRGQSCAQGQGRTARALRDPHEGLQTRGGGHAGNGPGNQDARYRNVWVVAPMCMVVISRNRTRSSCRSSAHCSPPSASQRLPLEAKRARLPIVINPWR